MLTAPLVQDLPSGDDAVLKSSARPATAFTLRLVVWALALLLVQVGIVRASHYHSHEAGVQADHHLDCTICLDANQVGIVAAKAAAPLLARIWGRVPEAIAKSGRSRVVSSFYDARGPPAA